MIKNFQGRVSPEELSSLFREVRSVTEANLLKQVGIRVHRLIIKDICADQSDAAMKWTTGVNREDQSVIRWRGKILVDGWCWFFRELISKRANDVTKFLNVVFVLGTKSVFFSEAGFVLRASPEEKMRTDQMFALTDFSKLGAATLKSLEDRDSSLRWANVHFVLNFILVGKLKLNGGIKLLNGRLSSRIPRAEHGETLCKKGFRIGGSQVKQIHSGELVNILFKFFLTGKHRRWSA
jgi:hypothetical protein